MSLRQRITTALRTPPMRFQVRGVRFIEQCGGRVVVGDDMGLGKTYQAIAWMMLHPEARPAVIVCPASVKYVWQNQLREHAGLRCTVLAGRKPYHVGRDIRIINYDILHYWVNQLKSQRPRLLILDEAHRAKTRTTQRTKACKSLARKCKYVIGMSGTPILSRPVEFFPVLNMVRPKLFRSFWRYAMQYCDPKRGFRGRGWDFRGASNLDELRDKLSTVMIRRTKTEVLPDLPRKTRTTIPVDIDNRDEYETARDDFIEWVLSRQGKGAAKRALGAVGLVRLGKLKELAAHGKIRTAIQWIEEWMQDNDGKLIVFTIHKEVLHRVAGYFHRAIVVEGRTSMKDRRTAVERFQKGKSRLFLGNIKAAGEGLTLHAASTVLFLEVDWVPATHEQAEDRVLRIGQTASHVDVYYMVGKDTVEEAVMKVVAAKRRVVRRVLDGGRGVQKQVVKSLMKGVQR